MKGLAIYWFIGCCLVGLAVSSYAKRCPKDLIPIADWFYTVAIWPATIVYAIAGSGSEGAVLECKRLPEGNK